MGYNKLLNTNGIFKKLSVTDEEHFTVDNITSTFVEILFWLKWISLSVMWLIVCYGYYLKTKGSLTSNWKYMLYALILYVIISIILIILSFSIDTDDNPYYSNIVGIMLIIFYALLIITGLIKYILDNKNKGYQKLNGDDTVTFQTTPLSTPPSTTPPTTPLSTTPLSTPPLTPLQPQLVS